MSIASILIDFSNSFTIHDEKTKEIITMKKVWKCDLNCHNIG